MNTNRGATLVELMIAMLVIMIVSLGFFNWLGTVMRMNTSIERTNTAYAMANDVADRLQRMNDNALIKPNTTINKRCVGYDGSANLRACSSINCAAGGSPNVDISIGSTGLIKFADPANVWKVTTPNAPIATRLYLYAKSNGCADKTWVDSACRANAEITVASDETIDHPNPNAATTTYDSINPIRSIKNATYYAVWSVAYMPCNPGTNTDKRKIFITVYWITPEPTESTAAAVRTKITSGAYTLKSVSLVVDKTIGAEK